MGAMGKENTRRGEAGAKGANGLSGRAGVTWR
jgi:hypothetical protein